jgi:hypothetical protein
MIAPKAKRPVQHPAVIEQETAIRGLQGDVAAGIGSMTQIDAALRVVVADANGSLQAGQAEVQRRLNPVSVVNIFLHFCVTNCLF